MTCIAAITEKGKVYMGGDSAGVSGYDITIRADEKVFKNGQCVFGFTSSFRMGQLLCYKFKVPVKPPKMMFVGLDRAPCQQGPRNNPLINM